MGKKAQVLDRVERKPVWYLVRHKSLPEADGNVNCFSLEGAITSVVGKDNAPWDNRTQRHHIDKSSWHSKLRDFIIKGLRKSPVTICVIPVENCYHSEEFYNEGSKTLGPRKKRTNLECTFTKVIRVNFFFWHTGIFLVVPTIKLFPLYIHTRDKNSGCQVQSLQYKAAFFFWKMYLARFINQLLKSHMRVPVDLRQH